MARIDYFLFPLSPFSYLAGLKLEAIAARIHHAMADGIAGVRFLDSALFDARAAARDRAAGTAPGLHEAPRPTPLTEALRLPGALRALRARAIALIAAL